MAGKHEGSSQSSASSTDGPITDKEVIAVDEGRDGGPVPTSQKEQWDLEKADSKVVHVNEDEDDPLKHLPAHEKEIIKRQLDVPPVKVTYFTLFRYATVNDKIIIVIASFCAIAAGAIMPLMNIVFGRLAGSFTGLFRGTVSHSSFTSELSRLVLYFVYLAIGEFVTTYVATTGFLYTGEHIAQKVREQYLAAILRSNIAFFDKLGSGEVTTRITADTSLVQDGLSQKVGLTLTALASFFTAFIIGFIYDWKLTLILSSCVFTIVLTMGGGSTFIIKYSKKSLASYALGGTIAEEVISSIRNATAFSTQDKLARQYDVHLEEAEKWGTRSKAVIGCMIAVLLCVIHLLYALGFWQGSRYVVDGQTTVSDILIILFSVMIGAFQLANVGPNIQAFTTAVAAANKIYSTIDRPSPLDPTAEAGEKPAAVNGTVELINVKHIYPSRPEVCVMEDVNLVVPAGKITALVGASGSGKSTIVGLVERFYDPVGGRILLDGHNIQDLNLRWLRQHISLVSQEPTLFGTTITGNIRHGLIGTKYENVGEEKQQELIMEAARMANAHDFITALPEWYETNVGERGFLLSGGQKQRIAIARAIVSDPKILLLDEATSALDTKSEGVVQAALDKAAEGRTTIVIAHRLSTIKNAHNIVVMSHGRIVEQGTHDELLEKQGAYYNLVEAQRIAATNEEKDPDEVSILDEKDGQLRQTSTSEKVDAFAQDPDDVNPAAKLTRSHTGKSASSQALQAKKQEDTRQYSLWTLIKVVTSFNRKEWHLMLFGLFWSIICGGGQPTQAIFFAHSVVALSLPPNQYGQLRSQIDYWTGLYFMLAIVQLIAFASQGIIFAYCSERLIYRVRDQAFRTMLRQEIGFFDKEENSSGALTSFLSTGTTNLAGLSGATLGTLLQVTTTLVAAIIVGISVGWKLGLVTTSTIPILLGCGFFRFWLLQRFEQTSKKAYESSASYACEATSAIRTVASLTREHDVWEHYHEQLVAQARKSLISVLKASTLYAASQSFMFLCMALGFWYGGTLLADGEYNALQFFIVFAAVIFSAQSAGTIFSFAPDMGKAKNAAAELKKLFDRVPLIDSWSNEGSRIDSVEGNIEFR